MKKKIIRITLGLSIFAGLMSVTACGKTEKPISDEKLGEIAEDTEVSDGINEYTNAYGENIYVNPEDSTEEIVNKIQIGATNSSEEESKEAAEIESEIENEKSLLPETSYETDGEETKLTFKVIDAKYLDGMSYDEFIAYKKLNIDTLTADELDELAKYEEDRIQRDSKFSNDRLAAYGIN